MRDIVSVGKSVCERESERVREWVLHMDSVSILMTAFLLIWVACCSTLCNHCTCPWHCLSCAASFAASRATVAPGRTEAAEQ